MAETTTRHVRCPECNGPINSAIGAYECTVCSWFHVHNFTNFHEAKEAADAARRGPTAAGGNDINQAAAGGRLAGDFDGRAASCKD